MCGIIGYLNNKKECFNILFNGLVQLQNRGYDSAGITTIDCSNNFITTKFASTERDDSLDLLKVTNINHKNNIIGIGHTRWATHGAKTDMNSHPHTCPNNIFTIVHNGIIENYQTLKKELYDNSYNDFKSETDTEVIVNYLSYLYSKYNKIKSIEEIIQLTCLKLEGTYGLVILFNKTPTSLYCIRKGSPLLIGYNETESYVVSELSAFNNNVKQYYEITSDNLYTIKNINNKIVITNSLNINQQTNKLNSKYLGTCTFEPYTGWMEKEIFEQIDSTNRALSFGGRLLSNNMVKLGGLEEHINDITQLNNLLILGCGTSYYSAMIGANYFKELCNFENVEYIDGCEFTEKNIKKNKLTGIICLSQSGETRDLMRCIEIGKQHDCFLIGVVNVVDSQISREVACGVYLNAGREIAVASTKSFTSQCIVLALISIWIAQLNDINKLKRVTYIQDLRQISHLIECILLNKLNELDLWVDSFINEPSCFLIGKDNLLPITFEGSLKLKEISYIHAEGISSSSLKHGPLALIRENFPVILFVKEDNNVNKLINCYEELNSRRANIFSITTSKKYYEHVILKTKKENCILIENTKNTFINIIINIFIQSLSLKISNKKNYNPDKPRNLAKVVTVE
jgi:glucosamine--fructose-6-phosphate aminotransferase (isomerizing)